MCSLRLLVVGRLPLSGRLLVVGLSLVAGVVQGSRGILQTPSAADYQRATIWLGLLFRPQSLFCWGVIILGAHGSCPQAYMCLLVFVEA